MVFAPLVAEAARKIDLTDQPVSHLLHAFDDTLARAAVGAVLRNAIVFLHRAQ